MKNPELARPASEFLLKSTAKAYKLYESRISSYMFPQELRLVPFDAKCNKVSGKIMRVENEFVDFEISSKH